MRGRTAELGAALVVGMALVSWGGGPAYARASVTDGRIVGYDIGDTYFLVGPKAQPRADLPLDAELDYLDGGRHACAAAFSPDGDEIAYLRDSGPGGAVGVRLLHTDGSKKWLGGTLDRDVYQPVCKLAFSPDGSYVVAVLWTKTGDLLYRFEAGQQPVKIATGYGEIYWLDIKPGTDQVLYSDYSDDLQTVDARTLATGTIPNPSTGWPSLAAWDPAGDRLLIATHGDLRWWSPGSAPQAPLVTKAHASRLFISPTGNRVAWSDGTTAHVASSSGGNITKLDAANTNIEDWQPCPGGDCPSFVTASPGPDAPEIAHASSGRTGGQATATARWKAPNGDGKPIQGYKVRALRLDGQGQVVRRTVSDRLRQGARMYAFRLPNGRYAFQVMAMNALGRSAWSARSNIVKSR